MQEPAVLRWGFEHPRQALSPQGQAPLGMGVAAQLLRDTKDLLEQQLWESALIMVRVSASTKSEQCIAPVSAIRVYRHMQRIPAGPAVYELDSLCSCMRYSDSLALTGM